MSYTKHEFQSGETLYASDLNEMDNQIHANTEHSENSGVHVTASEKETWNKKSDFSGDYNDLINRPTIPEGADLTGYAKESYVQDYAQPKGDYATSAELGQLQNTIADQQTQIYNLKNPEAPTFVDSVDEMTDTNKSYVNTKTGTIWVHKTATVEKTLTDVIESTADNPASNGQYVNKGNLSAKTDSFATPFIDLTKYSGTIKLIVKGATCIYDTATAYYQCAYHKTDGTYIDRCYMTLAQQKAGYVVTMLCDTVDDVIVDGDITTLQIALPRYFTTTLIEKIRFGCLGTWETSQISVEYTGMVTEATWVDTGVSYGGSCVDNKTLSNLNNEGTDPTTIKLLAKPVLDFYNSADYSSDDYTTSHLEKITYPCRADIPVPFTAKWNHNENAMRTTLAVDTKTIGTVNRFTMRTYDVTGVDNYPIYNLLPNTTYYYKVTHILSDGSLVEAKSGSFTTSNESIRLIHIDGTQNVRDLGGWTGLDGKKVKYGKLFRGATFSDSSYVELMLTGKGKRSLGELAVQAELNLGAYDTKSEIAQNITYKKIGYTNYASAITDSASKGLFKEALEWVVETLNASKPIYIHCQGGCDRTGTFVFQLLGLLGVSESDIAKDYELSSFSNIGFGRRRTTTKAVDTYDYVGMVEALKTYSGSTITEKFYNYAIGCGVSSDTITSFRTLMLE